MCFVIVNKHAHLPLWMARQIEGPRDSGQQAPEPDVVATTMDHGHSPAGGRVHSAPVAPLRCSHTGSQDNSLLPGVRPAAGDGRQQAHFGCIAQQENVFRASPGREITDLFFSLRRDHDPAYA